MKRLALALVAGACLSSPAWAQTYSSQAQAIVQAGLNASPVTLAQGGTGATTQAGAQTNLGLGTMATQSAGAVAVTGGTISGAALNGTVGATTPSTGRFSAMTSPATPISVTDPQIGATCNGTADDTTALNTMAANSHYVIPAGAVCVINSGNVTIPAGTLLEGNASVSSNWYTLTGITGIAINPAYSIIMGYGTTLSKLFIYRKGLQANPTAAQAAALYGPTGTLSAETSTAIVYPANTASGTINNLFVVGFVPVATQLVGQSLPGLKVVAVEAWHADYRALPRAVVIQIEHDHFRP